MIPEFDMSDEKIHYGEKTVDSIKKAALPLYIWGYDITAITLHRKLEKCGVPVAGFITDRVDVKIDGVIPHDDFIRQNPGLKYSIIRGFRESFLMSDDEIRAAWSGCQNVYTLADCYDDVIVEEISREFYTAHKAEFDEVYDNLADEHSKKSLAAYLQAKVLKTQTPVLPLIVSPQYFFAPAPWKYSDDDVLLDCGAFDGDSILDFISLRGDRYGEIIACEPDPGNFATMNQNLRARHVERFLPLNFGLGSEKTTLKFKSNDSAISTFTDNGDLEISVETIDNIFEQHRGGDKFSLIKMDIEGFEMPALLGGERTIKACRPILMISAYHKRDDVFNIYRYVNGIVSDYKFCFRCHKTLACDTVLYAIPSERFELKEE